MRRRGEVTVFLSAAMMLVCAVLLVTVEAARTSASAAYTQMLMNASVESCFGEFYRPLWEKYRVMAYYEAEPLEDRVEHYWQAASEETRTFFAVEEPETKVLAVTYLTEACADALQESGADYMKYYVAAEAMQDLTEQVSFVKQLRRAASFVKKLAAFSEQVLEVEETLREIRRLAETIAANLQTAQQISGELVGQIQEIRLEMANGLPEETARELFWANAYEAAERLQVPLENLVSVWPKIIKKADLYREQASSLTNKLDAVMEEFHAGDYTGAIRALLEEQTAQIQNYSSAGGSRYGDAQKLMSDLFAGLSQAEMYDQMLADLQDMESLEEGLTALESWSGAFGRMTWALPEWLTGLGELQKIGEEVVCFDAEIWTQESLLRMAIGEGAIISEAELSAGERLSERVAQGAKGTEKGVISNVLFREYAAAQLSHYCGQKADHAMKYELEYLLGGQRTDRENLLAVVWDLLLLRESVTFVEYLCDPMKCQEAAGAAAAIAGAAGVPYLTQVLQTGILAAWALSDAALDVRALMQGEAVPLLTAFGETAVSLDYKGHLKLLLAMTETESLRLGCLDVMQETMQKEASGFELSKCVYAAEVLATAECGTLFGGVPLVGLMGANVSRDGRIVVRQTYSYDS